CRAVRAALAMSSPALAAEYPPLERVRWPGLAEFRSRYARRGRPVVLEGLAEDWRACTRWCPEYFAERYGGTRVRAYAQKDGRISVDPKHGFRLLDLTLAEYVERAQKTVPDCVLRLELPGVLPQLLDDLQVPDYCAGRSGLRRNVWFAGEGSISDVHFDLPHNFYAQLHGRKRFILFEPGERWRLYKNGWFSSMPQFARVDPERRDDPAFPRFREADGRSALLEPGDVLFIPSLHWHHARALTLSIAVNFWTPVGVVKPLLFASDVFKRVRQLRR
ncbi:MAG TPA: cupin-like domain-containing protein, partial [Polyangiaceae bacterium]